MQSFQMHTHSLDKWKSDHQQLDQLDTDFEIHRLHSPNSYTMLWKQNNNWEQFWLVFLFSRTWRWKSFLFLFHFICLFFCGSKRSKSSHISKEKYYFFPFGIHTWNIIVSLSGSECLLKIVFMISKNFARGNDVGASFSK